MKTMTKLFAILTILATSAPASAYIIGGDDEFEGDAIVGTGAADYIIGGDLDEIQPPFVD